jgi:hypothetical protein
VGCRTVFNRGNRKEAAFADIILLGDGKTGEVGFGDTAAPSKSNLTKTPKHHVD